MRHFFILALLPLLLASCVRYYVSTNSFIDSDFLPKGFPKNSSFAIVPSEEYNALFSKEVARKISKILEDRGYQVSNIDKADYYLFFDFGIESSTTTINVPKYIPGQTRSTQGNVYGSHGGYVHYQEKTQSSGTTVFVPESYTFFTRELTITVYDAKAYRKKKLENLIWHGRSVSSGSNGDLRQTIDYLIVTTFDTFGISTGKIVSSEISESDRRVRWLRGEPIHKKVRHWDED